MSDLKDVLVPDVGGEEVEVIEVCVAVGEEVEAEASLITVESDKASMDIPAPFAGTVKEILVNVGDKVSQDSLLMKFQPVQQLPASSTSTSTSLQQEATPAPAPRCASPSYRR